MSRLVYLLATLGSLAGVSCMHKYPQNFPKPAQKPYTLEKHGDKRSDPYFWLRERENPEVVKYLQNENIYTNEVMAHTLPLQEKLFLEMKSRIKENDSSYPFKKGEYQYWSKFETGKQYPVYMRKLVKEGSREETLLDGNEMAKGLAYFQTTGPMISPNTKLMAYGVDSQGRRFFNIHFKDLSTGKNLDAKLENMTGNMVWAQDNETVFFSQQDPKTLRADKIYRYNIKTHKKDLVFEEKDETFNAHVGQGGLPRNYIFISSSSTLTSEIRYVSSHRPTEAFKVFYPRHREHEYSVVDGGDRFYVFTNDGAPNFKLMETPIEKTDKKHWKEVLPHRTDELLGDVEVFKNHLVVLTKKDGLDHLRIYRRDTMKMFEVPFQDASYSLSLHSNVEYEPTFVRFDFESLRLPESTFDLDLETQKQTLRKTREVPSYNPELYRTERLWVVARDGTKVPVSLLMLKDIKPKGENPMLVYGYGSYGMSMDAYFMSSMFSLIDRGFVFAMAHIRGGSELGRAWYDNGRVLNKKNTFNDFIDITEWLIKNNYANSKRVYAMGGSAGGLLMGTIINDRPDLYNGIVAQVPFVDVVTTMLDDTIPLTTGEYDEWGNPNEKQFYDYIKSYSPYDNVGRHPYPNMLVTTGLHDSQV
ncbi:MAG: S9 family peptidase, partial [Bdellovibrionota bacterium]